ncbi:MAG: LPS export ABC transporter periplasmic protein LptC [Pseudomonadota bacterium]
MIRFSRILLPSGVGVLAAILILAPLSARGDISFVLAKDSVALAEERMRLTAATYRGEDGKGQPFVLRAGSAVQTSSLDPVVRLGDLSANIALADGPAMLKADAGRYDMNRETLMIDGPISFIAADGFRLDTRDVAVGLKTRKLASRGPVSGRLPIGTFTADQISADLGSRAVVLEGRVRLHITQRGGK